VGQLNLESVFWHYSHVDTKSFQHFINDLAKRFPHSLNFLQVNNAKFHKSKSLKIPENIILLFQSPELNPIERMWRYIKQFLAWHVFDSLEQLHQKLEEVLLALTSEVVSSVTGFQFILDLLSVLSF